MPSKFRIGVPLGDPLQCVSPAPPTLWLCPRLKTCLVFATPWTAAHQASLSFTISWSWLKLMSIESVMPSNHLILCHPLLLLPSIFPSIRVFSNELALCIRWPKYWSFTFSLSPSNDGHTLFCGQLRRAFSQRHSKPSPEGATRCAPHCTCRVV